MIGSTSFIFSPTNSFALKGREIIAKNGVLDLRDMNFNEHKYVEMSGEWGIYWDKLVGPEQCLNIRQFLYPFRICGWVLN